MSYLNEMIGQNTHSPLLFREEQIASKMNRSMYEVK